jgi:hypothetical protein
MEIYLKKFLLGILCIGNISYANAQLDSLAIDSQKISIGKTNLLKTAIVPMTLTAYGALSLGSGSLRQFDRYVNRSAIGGHGYSGSVDNYLRYGPIVAVYGLDLVGVKAKNNFIDRSAMLVISIALTSTAVTLTKNDIYRVRPDGSGTSSFPSSHTAMAFVAAEFMNQEYKDKSIWFSVIGYGTATATGILRLYHHVHWFSDVVMGAGYGILTAKLSYLIYPYLKKIFTTSNSSNIIALPSFQKGYSGISISYSLR